MNLASDNAPFKRHSSRGFTLLEALVAVVVISVGLLGLLGLQTVAVVNTHVSQSRTMASIAADDIADRIRANPEAADNGSYNAVAIQYNPADGATAPVTDCVNADCDAEQIGALDAWEWERTLYKSMRARGYVDCREPATPSAADPCRTFEIAVVWAERQEPNSALDAPEDDLCDDEPDRFQERCFMTVFRR
jgi:type IV pilus assembly protein PilV